jgi:hypothetical protein
VYNKKLECQKNTLNYQGVFEAGAAGCFTEDEMRMAIANRLSPIDLPPAPPAADEEVWRERWSEEENDEGGGGGVWGVGGRVI